MKANLVITSPPYATLREYDPERGFTPIPPERYSDWFRDVAANIEKVLAPDGSYLWPERGGRHFYEMGVTHRAA